MLLPVMPPVSPMLAKPVTVIPPGASYEPKWDGFRALVFRDGDDVEFGSRNERPMTRYFPELVRAAKAELPPRCVVDGEIVLPAEKGLDFEALQLRLHPAASRVRLLAEHTPARFIAFDLLALGDANLMDRPFSERRAALAGALGSGPSFHVTRTTTDPELGAQWLQTFEGAGLDGVIAKKLDGPYLPGKREMVKVKHHRDADCVAIGYRIHKSGEGVGSILLGLYRADGELQMVGGAASFSV
ncbi:ATP-dependent DNA ligase, partial [Mycolicibacterium fortuitum]|uniref:ATP-dependent DNA ligase n=1 Tax=Mycolicibacterium fortuitum TaxID=1766 RepID=UPI0007EA6E63